MFSVDHVDAIRAVEIKRLMSFFPAGARILEIGAGTGKQALELQRRGCNVTAIEMPTSNYAANRVFPIIDYDGVSVPLPDASADIVFSSNVLEHVPDLTRMHSEIRRVLAPGGKCVHVMPTHGWRFWTTVSSYPDAIVFLASSLPRLYPRTLSDRQEFRRLGKAWKATARGVAGRCLPRRHGERGNVVSELWLFHPRWWRRNFAQNGFAVIRDEPMGLFYTGNMLLGTRLGWSKRQRLAAMIGSASHLFELVPSTGTEAPPAARSRLEAEPSVN